MEHEGSSGRNWRLLLYWSLIRSMEAMVQLGPNLEHGSSSSNKNTEQSICDVDFNRSYPYKWNKIYNICISFLGISKECELEVKSYANYLVTLHSYEGFILYPWGYQKKLYTDDRKNLHKLGEEMRNAIENISGADYNVGQSADILYRANGYSNDYAKSLGIKYVFTIEIGSRKMYNFGFIILKSYISKLAEEALAEILVVSQKISKENIVESNIK
uniref:Peptidase M14 domain-containing protein n=1 Tax=Strongyloides stercoralis TaxID=6248 RepID=A0AAF5DP48_STRER